MIRQGNIDLIADFEKYSQAQEGTTTDEKQDVQYK